MIPAFVLVTGVLVIMVIGAAVLAWMGLSNILVSLLPLAPLVVMVGTFLLILTEFLLFLGNKEDRRSALQDLIYLVPTCAVSGGLWYLSQVFLR